MKRYSLLSVLITSVILFGISSKAFAYEVPARPVYVCNTNYPYPSTGNWLSAWEAAEEWVRLVVARGGTENTYPALVSGSPDSTEITHCEAYKATQQPPGVTARFYQLYSCDFKTAAGPVSLGNPRASMVEGELKYTCITPDPVEPKNNGSCGVPGRQLFGNPINVGTGNKVQVEQDYSGPRLSFTRYYNSKGMASHVALGPMWLHSYSLRIDLLKSDPVLIAVAQREDGRILRFTKNGAAWIAEADSVYRLSSTTNAQGKINSWTLTTPTAVEQYRADGNISERIYPKGDRLQFAYSDASTPKTIAPWAGMLIGVQDSFGAQLSLRYDSHSHIREMVDPAGGVTTYSYTPGRLLLSTVAYPGGATKQYHYGELALTSGANLPYALTGITDENNSRFANFAFDSSGRAISTEYAGGANRYAVAYSGSQSTVTTPLGAVSNSSFTNVVGAVVSTSQSQPAGSGCGPASNATTYDANGNIASRTDFNSRQTTYLYDLSRNLETSRTEAAGTPKARTITTQWHPTYRLPTQIDEPGKRTTYTHDSAGNVLTTTVLDTVAATSRTTTFTYNSYGQVLTADGPRTDVSDVTLYSYHNCTTGYQCGQVATVTNALSQITQYLTYNAHGQPLTILDANNVLTTLTYDARQRLTSRDVGGEITGFEYWPTGLLKKVTLPDTSYLSYAYDAAHRLTGISDSESNSIVYTLDAMGNRMAENVYDPSSALSRTSSRVFDALSRLSQDLTASGSPTQATLFGYDANGNPTTVNAPLGRNSLNEYDELNRLKQVTDPNNGITQYGYNALDQLISVTDPRNLQTIYTYNALGDLKQQISPDTGTTINTFDSGGNLKTSKDARNKTATYTYDALNRASQVAYGDQTILYGYDAGTNGVGRLTSTSDSTNAASWLYDSLGRVTSKTQTVGTVVKTTGYGYTNGNLTSITTPYGAVIAYSYAHGKVSGITVNGASLLTNVLYEPFGPTNGWTWGNGTFAVRTYDTDGKITQLDSAGLNTYGYDDAFRITGITDTTTPANSSTYGYDSLDRLNSATKSGLIQGFTYDADGNRLTQTGTTPSTLTYPATSNKLASIAGTPNKTYSYDLAGNTLSDGTIVYTYYNSGRMKTAKNGAAAAVTYTYNALGQRVKKTGTTRFFVYDEAGHLQGEYNSSGTMVQEFVWLGDTPVAVLTPKTGGVNIFYIHTDHLNTPRKITRPSDNKLRWTWNPDAFGKGAPNENPQALGAFVFNLRFPGQYADAETGLLYNWNRYYSPTEGRYITSDPIGLSGGLNTYAYVGGNPISRIDPSGLQQAIPMGPGLPTPWPEVGIPGSPAAQRWADSAYQAGKAFMEGVRNIIEACTEKTCAACTPYAKGTIGFIGPHIDHDHFPIGRPHLNLFVVNQNPNTCKCFWNKATPDAAAPPPQPGWVDLNSGFPALSP